MNLPPCPKCNSPRTILSPIVGHANCEICNYTWPLPFDKGMGETVQKPHFAACEDAPTAIGTEARVCADIAKRQHHGIAKYGMTVEGNPLTLRQWLQHAYEETLDQAIYLRRAIEELDKPNPNQ